jgi:hypothetical protein
MVSDTFRYNSQMQCVLKSVPQPGHAVDETCFEKVSIPLTEDLHLQKFPPLHLAHKDLIFDVSSGHNELSPQQQVLVTSTGSYCTAVDELINQFSLADAKPL